MLLAVVVGTCLAAEAAPPVGRLAVAEVLDLGLVVDPDPGHPGLAAPSSPEDLGP